MKKLFCAFALAIGVTGMPVTASANPAWVSDVGMDRVAHYGCSFLISEELHRAGMNRFWAGATTLALGAAKEAWYDDHFDRGDFAADAAGVLTWEIRF